MLLLPVLSEVDTATITAAVTGVLTAIGAAAAWWWKNTPPETRGEPSGYTRSEALECQGKWNVQDEVNKQLGARIDSVKGGLRKDIDYLRGELDRLASDLSKVDSRGEGFREQLSEIGKQLAVAQAIVKRIDEALR